MYFLKIYASIGAIYFKTVKKERKRGHKSKKAALMTSATLDTSDSAYLLFSLLKGKAH